MPKPRSYAELLACLHGIEPPVHVFGGFAEDALMHGTATRAHADLDVLVVRDELAMCLDQFEKLGFADFRCFYEIAPGEPLALNAANDGMNLEIGVFDRMADGRLSFRLRAPEGGQRRIVLPEDTLAFQPCLLDGIPVRTVSPLALYQIRAGIRHTGSFGGLRPTDVRAQEELKTRFFAGRDEADLLPRIDHLAPRTAGRPASAVVSRPPPPATGPSR